MAVDRTELAKHILEETGIALKTGDFQRFLRHFCMPTKVWTEIGEVNLLTAKDIQACFDRVRWHHRSLRITEVRRQCECAMQTADNTILSLHSVRLYRGNVEVQKPHKVLSTIIRSGSDWKISSSDYGISDSLKHNRALVGPIEVQLEHYDALCRSCQRDGR